MDETRMLLCMLIMGLGNLLMVQNYHFLLMLRNCIAQEENMLYFMEKKSCALRSHFIIIIILLRLPIRTTHTRKCSIIRYLS